MTEPEIEAVGAESEDPPLRAFIVSDGDCMVFDADLLDPENEDGEPDANGLRPVLAVQFRDGGLWWLSSRDRKWHSAEAVDPAKRAKLSPVK